jgi:hypothetical protein
MQCSPETAASISAWFAERLPAEWFGGSAEYLIDREEILVTGPLPDGVGPDAFREATRDDRMEIAAAAQHLFRRKVSWAVRTAEAEYRYTTLSVPVMTRLRIDERLVLDALIAGGIARSRSEALNWCVRLVARNESEWLGELADAAARIASIRDKGPLSADE